MTTGPGAVLLLLSTYPSTILRTQTQNAKRGRDSALLPIW